MDRAVQDDRVRRLLDLDLDLDPVRVAVLLVDVQNDFCGPVVSGAAPAGTVKNAQAAVRANAFAGQAAALGCGSSIRGRFSTWIG